MRRYINFLVKKLYPDNWGDSWGTTGQMPPRKIALQLGIGFGLGLVLGLGVIFLGGNSHRTQKIYSLKKKPNKKLAERKWRNVTPYSQEGYAIFTRKHLC